MSWFTALTVNYNVMKVAMKTTGIASGEHPCSSLVSPSSTRRSCIVAKVGEGVSVVTACDRCGSRVANVLEWQLFSPPPHLNFSLLLVLFTCHSRSSLQILVQPLFFILVNVEALHSVEVSKLGSRALTPH